MRTPNEFYIENPYKASKGKSVIDPFGSMDGRTTPHRGTDFWWNGIDGEDIPSWLPGIVTYADWYGGAIGWVVVIKGDAGWAGFCHLKTIVVSVGQRVEFGQKIGTVGSTGTASSGPHLHATLSHAGGDAGYSPTIDPYPWILSSIAAWAAPTESDLMSPIVLVAEVASTDNPVSIPAGANYYREGLAFPWQGPLSRSELYMACGSKVADPTGPSFPGMSVPRFGTSGDNLLAYIRSAKPINIGSGTGTPLPDDLATKQDVEAVSSATVKLLKERL